MSIPLLQKMSNAKRENQAGFALIVFWGIFITVEFILKLSSVIWLFSIYLRSGQFLDLLYILILMNKE